MLPLLRRHTSFTALSIGVHLHLIILKVALQTNLVMKIKGTLLMSLETAAAFLPSFPFPRRYNISWPGGLEGECQCGEFLKAVFDCKSIIK